MAHSNAEQELLELLRTSHTSPRTRRRRSPEVMADNCTGLSHSEQGQGRAHFCEQLLCCTGTRNAYVVGLVLVQLQLQDCQVTFLRSDLDSEIRTGSANSRQGNAAQSPWCKRGCNVQCSSCMNCTVATEDASLTGATYSDPSCFAIPMLS